MIHLPVPVARALEFTSTGRQYHEKRRPGPWPGTPGLRTPNARRLRHDIIQSRISQQAQQGCGQMSAVDLVIGGLCTLPFACLVLGTIALVKADRKDIPEIMRWLS